MPHSAVNTLPNVAIYTLITAATSPLSLADLKSYLKITNTAEDALLQRMIDSATEWGENYTRRDFRAINWTLALDFFPSERIVLRRDPVDSINEITYPVDDVETIVDNSIYYLKKDVQTSEVVLRSGEDWPSDGDDIEQSITVDFATVGYFRQNLIIDALSRHIAHWYRNRGDCNGGGTGNCSCDTAAKESGATDIYDQFRVSRV